MQKLGQHFLKNAAILEKIVGALALADNDRIIEVGSGHGELTVPLAREARNKHCVISCLEKDHALIGELEALAAKENSMGDDTDSNTRITIIEGDALKLLPKIASEKTSLKKLSRYKIVGNIPYYITGKLLRIISELEEKPERVVLLIQKEVAKRICSVPPEMNRLAASVQFWADATIVATVPRKDFFPAPTVDSAIIVLSNKKPLPKSILPSLYYRAMRAIFAQPRKTLLNNLSVAVKRATSKGDIADCLKQLGIAPGARPQDLSIEQITAIARANLWG